MAAIGEQAKSHHDHHTRKMGKSAGHPVEFIQAGFFRNERLGRATASAPSTQELE